jgi:uncharacterized coiled-coil protein SlyX
MIRQLDEMKEQFFSMQGYLKLLDTNQITADTVKDQLKRLAGNLYDLTESVEEEINNRDKQIADQAGEIHNLNLRTVAMIKDMKLMQDKLEELTQVEKQVEKLSDIILSRLADLPVKGADEDVAQ